MQVSNKKRAHYQVSTANTRDSKNSSLNRSNSNLNNKASATGADDDDEVMDTACAEKEGIQQQLLKLSKLQDKKQNKRNAKAAEKALDRDMPMPMPKRMLKKRSHGDRLYHGVEQDRDFDQVRDYK